MDSRSGETGASAAGLILSLCAISCAIGRRTTSSRCWKAQAIRSSMSRTSPRRRFAPCTSAISGCSYWRRGTGPPPDRIRSRKLGPELGKRRIRSSPALGSPRSLRAAPVGRRCVAPRGNDRPTLLGSPATNLARDAEATTRAWGPTNHRGQAYRMPLALAYLWGAMAEPGARATDNFGTAGGGLPGGVQDRGEFRVRIAR